MHGFAIGEMDQKVFILYTYLGQSRLTVSRTRVTAVKQLQEEEKWGEKEREMEVLINASSYNTR